MNRAVWIVINLAAGISALLLACNKPTEPDDAQPVSLRAVDASCTEVWLEVKLSESIHPRTIEIRRDTTLLVTTTLSALDTLIVEEGLLPNRQYTYTLTRRNVSFGQPLTATITTLDTTSHNFTWQIDTLGDGSSSVLYDVAIINDTLAYAVGEIYKRDSVGNWDPNAYNMVRWNGNTWELMRIPFIGPCSAVDYPPLKAIWAISANQILVTNGGAIATYNGTTTTLDCRMNSLLTGAINKLYATSAQDIYAVANNGTIVHYSNGTWRRIESGTTLNVYDIFGTRDNRTGEVEILAVASNVFVNFDRRILRIDGTTATTLSDSGINWSLRGVWFLPDRHYYVVGSGIYEKRNLFDARWHNGPLDITTYYTNAVSGTGINSVVVAGAYGEFLVFNGARWRSFRSQTGLINGQYYAVATRGSLIVAVGYEYPRAVVLRGWREQ